MGQPPTTGIGLSNPELDALGIAPENAKRNWHFQAEYAVAHVVVSQQLPEQP